MRTLRAIVVAALLATAPALAQVRFSTLYSFSNGYHTGLSLVDGELYGVSVDEGCGTAFELNRPQAGGDAWTETVLYTFASTGDACSPGGGPVAVASGALYGLTASGGATGYGALYELQPPAAPGGAWAESVAYSFLPPDNTPGGPPLTPLVAGPDGSFYLLTVSSDGLVQLVPPVEPGSEWNAVQLFEPTAFMAGSALIAGPGGTFYGASEWGGTGEEYGYVFQLAPPSEPGGVWTCTVIHGFAASNDGVGNPYALTLNGDGTIYGAAFGSSPNGGDGEGAIFSLTPPKSPGGTWSYATLYDFGPAHPDTAPVPHNGKLYGALVTAEAGAVFELQPPTAPGGVWTLTYLHRFTGGPAPFGQLIVNKDGTIYGYTGTVFGGTPSSGTVFKISTQ
jgi:hypothetical protein